MIKPSMRNGWQRAVVASAALAWVLGVGAGSFVLFAHADAPGATSAPPELWPRASKIDFAGDRPTLVLFAHPRCPCTTATIGELSVLMTNTGSRAAAHVLFFEPENDPGWARGSLWDEASRIPGVSVNADPGGREASRFGAATSGDTFLFLASGALAFRGGITGSRGHAGDNAGRSAIEAIVAGRLATISTTPVFGCAVTR